MNPDPHLIIEWPIKTAHIEIDSHMNNIIRWLRLLQDGRTGAQAKANLQKNLFAVFASTQSTLPSSTGADNLLLPAQSVRAIIRLEPSVKCL
jgi:hypothetical protein